MATFDRLNIKALAQGQGPARLAIPLLGLAVIAFALAQMDLWGRNGFWIDEYFSLWASDPAAPLATLIGARILPDTNPPLYFTLLALVRPLIEEPRAAFLALNIVAIAAAAVFVVLTGRRAQMPAAGLAAAAAFIVSGPVLCYAPEGRAYLFGLCAAFAIAWASALAVERDTPGARRDLIVFGALGALAGLTHVFAALFAGAFAAALVAEGALNRRRALIRAGLALGLAATAVFGVWLLSVLDSMGNVAWIEFTIATVREALWYVRQLAFGHVLIALALLGFLGWAARRAAMRPHLRVFAIAMALFALLPALASFVMPMITGRYWLIGAPALIVLAVLAIRAELDAGDQRGRWGAVFGAASLAGTCLFGFFSAQAFTEAKPVWRGTGVVAPLLAQCGAGDVRVWDNGLYAAAAAAPEALFQDAARPETAPLDAAVGACPVLGWAEHVRLGDDFIANASDQQLLDMLKITGASDARILRHESGFVVLRGEPENGH